MNCAEAFNAHALSIGVTTNVEYVFEKGDPEQTLRGWFTDYGFNDPVFRWKKVHVDRKGMAHDPFRGLQAADWLAYEYYLASDRCIYKDPSTVDRWALSQFEKIPGEVIFLESNIATDLHLRSEAVRKLLHSMNRQ